MTRDQAREKVKKLLRLGKSSNMHEAAAAMRQAQALMRLHAIEESDVRDREPDEIGECATAPRRGKNTPVDIVQLSNVVARTFGVKVYFHTHVGFSPSGGLAYKTDARFVGPASRIDLARYAFDVLERQLQRDKKDHLRRVRVRKNREARGDEYGIGWTFGVSKVLESWAVTDAERDGIAAWMTQHCPDMKTVGVKAREARAVTFNDRHSGHASGSRATLNRGVGGSRQQQLGGSSK